MKNLIFTLVKLIFIVDVFLLKKRGEEGGKNSLTQFIECEKKKKTRGMIINTLNLFCYYSKKKFFPENSFPRCFMICVHKFPRTRCCKNRNRRSSFISNLNLSSS